ncbi:DUF421 domain-containing protein [Brevibacillus humidisoli]|uniref:DUF421 domain-containing protein n=1 Tax=Brevibacillus humidisoli TaxID=2895522 RepID=UPI001E306DCE|nr:DUF421 domain-containing protein [Brevibacillus humidisoli]UFJ39522.1 DUF421 domain-containing protein [Brevibacillus humidisoli]
MKDVHALEMIGRATVTFLVLLLLTRLLGKKQVGQLTFFNYVAGITIGSIAAEIAARREAPVVGGLISLIWWVVLTFVIGFIGMKSGKARLILDGQPTIVIKKGKILERALAGSRLNMDDLSMMLRVNGVFSIKDVEYAILEPNGKISILKKTEKQTATKQDVQVPTPPLLYLPTEIIVDGKLIKQNLDELNLSQAWLGEELKKAGVTYLEEVFYAELQSDGSLHVDKRDDLLS